MLNLFAVLGHIHYARSARIYIQEMEGMKATNPWLEEKRFSYSQKIGKALVRLMVGFGDRANTLAFFQKQRRFDKRQWNDGNGSPPVGIQPKSVQQCMMQ